MKYLGDFLEDAIVPLGAFTTNAADGGRESFSASLEEADITIYSDDGDGTWTAMTLDASTIIITENPGSQVGVYLVAVDMSNDADFVTGKDYVAVLYPSDETIDSQSVAAVLGHWSCENRTVNVDRINGSSTAAVRLALGSNAVIPGTVNTGVTSPSTTNFSADDITEATADHYIGRVILFTAGALLGQATTITDYALVSSEGNFTVDALTEAPGNNDTFIIV